MMKIVGKETGALMKRNALKSQLGNRSQYHGVVDRFGTKRVYRGVDLQTVLLTKITDASGQLYIAT